MNVVSAYSLLHCLKFLLYFFHLILQSEKERENIKAEDDRGNVKLNESERKPLDRPSSGRGQTLF